jgi:hypothetical protein
MLEPLQCPYCKSNRIRISKKEVHSAWQIGFKVIQYERGRKATFDEADCLNCGKTFLPGQEPLQQPITPAVRSGEPQALAVYPLSRWAGKKLTVETRLGVSVQAEVTAENVSARVQTKGGDLLAQDQLMIEMKESVINLDSPLVVTMDNLPIGMMWASSVSPKGYTAGIVQLINTFELSSTALKPETKSDLDVAEEVARDHIEKQANRLPRLELSVEKRVQLDNGDCLIAIRWPRRAGGWATWEMRINPKTGSLERVSKR